MPKMVLKGAARLDRLVRRGKAKLTPDRVRYFCHPDWVVAAEARPPETLWTPRDPHPDRPQGDRRMVPGAGLAALGTSLVSRIRRSTGSR